MNATTAILISIAAVLIALYYWLRSNPLLNRVNAIKTHQAFENGPQLWFEAGDISSLQLRAIKDGLHTTIGRALCAGYLDKTRLEDYTVALLTADANDSEGMPCFKIPAGEYKGTTWDQGDGTILSSGQAVDVKRCLIAIPYHTDDQLEHLERIVSYEIEHCILAANDTARYNATKIHTATTSHPLLKADCK